MREGEGEKEGRKETGLGDVHRPITSGEASSGCVRTKSADAAWTGSDGDEREKP